MNRPHRGTVTFALLVVLALCPFAPAAPAEDEAELSKKLIREYTTDPSFLNGWVDHIPYSDKVPSPLKILGHINGTPGKMTYYDDISRYFKILAERSENVEVFPIGKTDEGAEMFVAAIADARTIANLPFFKDQIHALADPRRTDESAARAIIPKAKPVYYLTGGLHSAETGSPEMLTELAYRLAVSEAPEIRRIRESVIVLITPVLEVDGWQRQVDWYYRHTKKYDKMEDIPLESPPFWGNYAFHDNNRDGMQFSQKLTKNVYGAFFEWLPQVTHDLHESLPFLYISTGYGPYNPNFDPVTTQEWMWIAQYEITEMVKMGLPGVWTWGFFDGWYPGFLLWAGNNYNAIGRFYETFGNAGANTFEREVKEKFMDKPVTAKEWYRAVPPPKKVKWSYRNGINYMQTGVIAALNLTAVNRDTILYNFWKKGLNSYTKGRTEAPYAWIIPSGQKNTTAVCDLVNLLLAHRIEIHEAGRTIKLKDGEFPAGSFVVRMDQPYRNHAKDLLEIQEYPKDVATRTYDDTGWTLGLLYGVETVKIDDPEIQKAPMSPLAGPLTYPWSFGAEKKVSAYLVTNTGSNSLISARYALSSHKVYAAEKEFQVKKAIYPAGSWIIPVSGNPGSLEKDLKAAAERYGLNVAGLERAADVPRHELDLPRLGVYHTWMFPQDAGWVYFTLERAGVRFAKVNDERLRKGDLGKDFDVLLFPNQWGDLRMALRGIPSKYSPLAYNRTEEFKYLGGVDSSDDITGGMRLEGLMALERFVDGGGLLVALDGASELPIQLGMADEVNLSRGSRYQVEGTIVRGKALRKDHPILYGCPEEVALFKGGNSSFEVGRKSLKSIVLQYGTKEPVGAEDSESYYMRIFGGEFGVPAHADPGPEIAAAGPSQAGKTQERRSPVWLSGSIKNEEDLDGRAAIMDVPFGKGRLVLFNFNPMYRYLNQANFLFVYNAVLNFNDVGITIR